MAGDIHAILDTLLASNRKGCWCEEYREPCSYHEAFFDGAEALLAAMQHEGIVLYILHSDWHQPLPVDD